MAKLEQTLQGSFDRLISEIESGILQGSMSANLEDSSDFSCEGVRCAVRVFERYSMMGGNRVSLSVTLLEANESLFLSAITAGGSQAVLWKVNTFGEEAFLDCLRDIISHYLR